MGKFKINDRHVAFCNAIAAGLDNYKAYQEHMSPGKKAAKATAAANASGLLKRPEIQEIIKRAKDAREAEITGIAVRNIPEEFKISVLTTDELDAFHSSIVLGKVDVEEYFQTYQWEEIFDKNGKMIKRVRKPALIPIKRKPNIREKQISMDALYKRTGSYAPSRLFAAIKNMNDDGDLENVERFVLLSNGDKIPLLPSTLKKAQ